jgi:4-hydroxy-tetrahydrodipicolinate reductase
MTKKKVIVWGTGFVGKMVVRELIGHPAFELVAVIVNDPDKDGVDVGELVGCGPCGVRATRDVDAALALDADAVAYYGPTAEFVNENNDNMARALRAGKNVVSTANTPQVYPPACPESIITPLEEACREGGTSCFTTGIDPGFANDLFPLTLMGLCGRVDRVLVQEILDYSTYTGDYGVMGFGEPIEKMCLLEDTNILLYAWGHTIPMMAHAMGVELERVESIYDKWPATERIEYPLGAIEKGMCAAVRFEIRGIVGGEPRIIIEHCNRITNAAAPDWPRPQLDENDCYRVVIDGSPNITQETKFRGELNGDANAGGCLSTGMRAIHAIPAVCQAEPGVLSALDLPLIGGAGNIH